MEDTVLPLVYNLGFLFILICWLNKEKIESKIGLTTSHLWFIAVLMTILAVVVNIAFVLNDNFTDVDNALWTGSEEYLNGRNPYSEKVVEHIDQDGNSFLSYYNYGPINLIIYSLFFIVFGKIFQEWWLFPSSIVLGITCYFIYGTLKGKVKHLVSLSTDEKSQQTMFIWDHKRDIPFFLILLSPFLVNNSILMLMFFMIGRYFRYSGNRTLEVSFYVLGAQVKFMTGLIVAIYFFDQIRSRDYYWKNYFPYITGLLLYIITILPFGIWPVINGSLLQQGDPSERTGQLRGPLLVEILLVLKQTLLLIPLAIVILIIVYFISTDRPFNDREVILCLTSLFLLPFYGTELSIIPLALILFRYTNLNEEKIKNKGFQGIIEPSNSKTNFS